jgi:hypothetical protein
MNFSDAIEAARFLKSENLAHRDTVCWKPRNCSAILAYMPKDARFWSPVLHRYETFDRWDLASHEIHSQATLQVSEVVQDTIRFFPDWGKPGGPLFVSMQRLNDPEQFGLRLMMPAPKSAWRVLDESFWIYGPAGETSM